MSSSNFVTPLVITFPEAEKPESFEPDSVVVFVDYTGKRRLQGRVIETLCDGTILCRIRGLRVPEPYAVGMCIPTTRDNIVAW